MAKAGFLAVILVMVSAAWAGRHPTHQFNIPVISAASAQIPQTVGYKYPVPPSGAPTLNTNRVPPATQTLTAQHVMRPAVSPAVPAASTQQQTVTNKVSTGAGNLQASAATQDDARQLHVHHMAQIQTIDVACGKERMTVRVTFDQAFDGIIYAKGHYTDPNCRFVLPNSGQRMYQFDMVTGQCGVQFIDSGLTNGGQAYVEGLLVIILEPGVQEAWDAARRIRCLWEGNIDQTVTFPLSINMLDSQTLTFSGDTASASLEIQNGRGPRAQTVQGLVRIGDLLTAVVTVQGDADFDLLVRNCVATDGTPNNRIVLSDNKGCATKPKLMGGWQKQRNTGNILSYAYLSAFKFPDVMDLFLECTVSLCKGACEECAEYTELHVPSHGKDDVPEIDQRSAVPAAARERRSVFDYNITEPNPQDSLRLRRVVHVVGPDDLPELALAGPAVYGGCQSNCFSLLSIVASVSITLLMVMSSIVCFGALRRRQREEKF